MNDLIKAINETTGFRVELIYWVDAVKEGYKARFYADTKDDYQMEELYHNPIDAVYRLAEAYGISV